NAMPRSETTHDTWAELREVLDEELGRLPDNYRAPLVLCDLEGRTRKEAARQLGLPEGTVASRLARARRLLATRLGRPGLARAAGQAPAEGSQAGKPRTETEALRREVELLRFNLELVLEKCRAQENELRALRDQVKAAQAKGAARDNAVLWLGGLEAANQQSE